MPLASHGAGSTKLFIKIGGIKGESSHNKWKDKECSDIDAFSLAATADWDFTQGKSTAGRVGFNGVHVVRPLVGATPVLFMATLKEQKTDKVEIFLGNETGADILLTIELSGEVRLTNNSISGQSGGHLFEEFTFTAPKLLIKRGDISSDINFQEIAGKNDDISM